jgi:hypothetical protein
MLVVGVGVFAAGTRFSDYTPLAASAGPVPLAGEATPITFGNPDFEQRTLSNRATQLAEHEPNSGSWDMNTTNETGPQKGRFLFTVFETGNSGVQRTDLETGVTDTIWQSPGGGRCRVVRPVLLDAVGHAHHRRGELGDRGRRIDQPVRTALRAEKPADRAGHSPIRSAPTATTAPCSSCQRRAAQLA